MKLEKALKVVGNETVSELEALSDIELKQRIVSANEAIRAVCAELEANEKYQEIKENKKALEAGRREVTTRQNAIIEVSLNLLNNAIEETRES